MLSALTNSAQKRSMVPSMSSPGAEFHGSLRKADNAKIEGRASLMHGFSKAVHSPDRPLEMSLRDEHSFFDEVRNLSRPMSLFLFSITCYLILACVEPCDFSILTK